MARTFILPLIFACLVMPGRLIAQEVQWLTASPNHWVLNPTTPVDVLCARDQEHVYTGMLDSITYTYNASMGLNTLRRQGSDGATLWSVAIGDTVQLESIVSDADGHVVIGGRYFQRLLIDGVPVLSVPPGHVSEGSFLCAFDASGVPLWQQDVSGDDLESVSVSVMALDHQGRVWAALSQFFGAEIVRLGSDGSQLESRSLIDSKMIGSISFDPWGGLYISGAATAPAIGINDTSFPVTETYAFFVTRINAAGITQWLRYAHDITFQKPRVQADATGHAYLLGSYMEPLTWGSIPFTDPVWSTSFFLARLDSLGTFEWGVQPPNAPGSGQFTLARGNCLGVDAAGNAHVLGTLGGTLDWGNGLTTGSGDITNNTVVLMRFDHTGAPTWSVEGGSSGTDIMNDLAVTSDGISHVIGFTSDPFSLGAFTVDPVNARGSVVGRIDPELSTALSPLGDGAEELTAYPSVFSTNFHLKRGAGPDNVAASVRVIDATGRTVETSSRLGLPMGGQLSTGTYIVQVRLGERLLRTRVVKD